MGTPDFAVKPLEALCDNGYDVCGVVTQPDKPVGRKAVLTPPPVKVTALERGLKVYQPESLKNGVGMALLEELKPDLCVVVAYGKILSQAFLDYPKYGCINIHGSLLPKYRGAAPIQQCVLDGEEYGGITSMQMDVGIDTGDMLLTEKVKIGENETAGELFDRLAPIGARVLLKTLELLEKGELNPVKQNNNESTYAKMLDKSMCRVDFNKTAKEVHNQIRGLDPWPVANIIYKGKTLKLFSSYVSKDISGGKAGTVKNLKDGFAVFCGDGNAVVIREVQYEGKKRMSAADFLRGNPTADGDAFES